MRLRCASGISRLALVDMGGAHTQVFLVIARHRAADGSRLGRRCARRGLRDKFAPGAARGAFEA